MSPSRSATRILRSQSLWWVAKKMSAVRGTWTAVWRLLFVHMLVFFLNGVSFGRVGLGWWVGEESGGGGGFAWRVC